MSSGMKIFNSSEKWGCLFPGIGVRFSGKEPLFFKRYKSIFKDYLESGSAIAGENLTLPLLAPDTQLKNQLSTEIFTYAFSYGSFKVMLDKGLQPEIVGGHSLGVYAALVAAECLTYEDGLQVIAKANHFGQQETAGNEFGALAIVGLDLREIEKELNKTQYQSIRLANYNTESSGVYVGLQPETDILHNWAEKEGAVKTVPIATDIPYHNPEFMQISSVSLESYLQTLPWQDPAFPIVSPLDHSLIKNRHAALTMTAKNLSTPIHWPGVLNFLVKHRIDAVFECGAGISLTQHSRFLDTSPHHYNLRNMRRKLDY